MRKNFITVSVALLLTVPLSVFAVSFDSLGGLINNFTTNVVKALGYLAMSAAVVAFFFGMVQFIWASREGKEEEMTKGKRFMVWALIALFVMFSVWGIIKFVQQTIGLPNSSEITIPTLNIGPSGGGGSGGGSATSGCNSSGCPSGQVCEITSGICKPDPGANGPF
ncbi:MAG: hypothetical protein QG653_575 [Patescibacteria group bacterium]|nr:hypothetical protein [Patescibacteria group bacterium]